MSARGQAGFTLFELVVAVAIGGIVMLFAAMFMAAPIDAYDAQSRRQTLVGDVSAAWPRMQPELFEALPNSARRRVNGNYIALEFMPVLGVTRYGATANVNSTSIQVGGSPAGIIKGLPANQNTAFNAYLSVNPNVNVYTLTGSITNTRRAMTWNTIVPSGAGTIAVATAPNLTAGNSPRRRLYLVGSPVTYLCDLTQGTLRRYGGYTVAASQASRSAPGQFGTATSNELIARGITACSFEVTGGGATTPQTISARFTATRSTESVTLLHESRGEYLP